MKPTLLGLILAFSFSLFSQEKIEIEKKVHHKEFPPRAFKFVRQLFPNQKIHWLKEKNEEQISYEAKLRFQNRKYSIEFDEYGRFEDLEFIVKESKVDSMVLKKIKQTLSKDFEDFKIHKIQEQWVGSEGHIRESVKAGKASTSIQLRYELVIYAKLKTAYSKFEYLFDEYGVFISKQKFSENNHDNFFY